MILNEISNPRCHIPGCDTPLPEFRTPWLQNAIPSGRNHQPSRCQRYPLISNSNISLAGPTCPASMFNKSSTYKCDRFVFDTDEINIANDVSWKYFYFVSLKSFKCNICCLLLMKQCQCEPFARVGGTIFITY